MDPCSLANILQVRTEHLHLDAAAHFDRKVLEGSVTLRMRVLDSETKDIVLDTRDVTVSAVTVRRHAEGVEEGRTSCALAFSMDAPHAALGTALRISLDRERLKAFSEGKTETEQVQVLQGEVLELRVEFVTSPESIGVQWLAPEQTEGKQHPYLFTQFQAIHCRTAIPCQDSPAVKTAYSAALRVPAPLVALMSAKSTGSELAAADGGWSTYHFQQPLPIPTYLIAIAIGKLESREIGPRSRVWAEKETVDKAAYEFADTELYLKTAEELLCPYEWGRYDVLCLPKSFPYGGMENPQLTFVTPTLLAGDRSLATVVAHEIAHSWCGNLVTNRHWENFWLNEGFTVFVERKIIGRLHGEAARQFDYIIGNKALVDSVTRYGADHNYTAMIPKLEGIDPDEAFSSVPYERGSQFLFFLESLVGDYGEFEAFIRDWIVDHRRQSVDTDQFRAFFEARFPAVKDEVNWQEWLYKPGMPPVDLLSKFDDSLAQKPRELAKAWSNAVNFAGHSAADISGWNTWQTVAFLEQIVLDNPDGLPIDSLRAMDEKYHFAASNNSEIRMLWLSLGLQSKDEEVFDGVVKFLGEQGRMKFIRPLYRDLSSCSENGRKLALDTFAQLKESYHNIAQRQVASDLGIDA